ncbi:D-alanyl-D-alanine carboxypeptidase family protein [Gellertiella hungarica]|uniref:serine-type D-Ala-D-Ala carboxypeptidase n=1 Tax=Gellertiella hungarica TaxID=1572859 RepID=A0A7W6J4S9_9HYPH|nr:D-alanyl-D-alanine carboxypeptidase family protein [Gellertiella hungarica]MBB4064767.1 D-alanyl-D-alanine carboxypeptidase (penicillin-binding protein 5/6) [Gellertiella hungarica]
MKFQLVSLRAPTWTVSPVRLSALARLVTQTLAATALCLSAGLRVQAAETGSSAFETKAKQAYLIEGKTGTVLLAKNENEAIAPASLAKILVAETVAGALANRETTLETAYPVTEHAWRTGGAPSGTATMFAALKSTIRVDDLLKGVMVLSANDACIILGEGISGSETQFAERMTNRARDLGLKVTTLRNATGLPHPDNRTTMKELVLLSQHFQQTYPDLYKTYTLADFEWNKIRQRNRNPLATQGLGIDGLATGFTEGQGYSIAASIERDGKRLFVALGGLANDKERQEETKRVLEWGLSSFDYRKLFAANEAVGEVSVYGGVSSHVEVAAKEEVQVFVPVSNPERITGHITYKWPIYAPVEEGREVGRLSLYAGPKLLREVPLYTRQRVEEGGLTDRAFDAVKELLLFWW